MSAVRGIWGWGILLGMVVSGCASWAPVDPGSQPFFQVDPIETKAMHLLAKKQDGAISKCMDHNTCDHAYFMRALTALYESRDSASKNFEKVVATAPKSQLAATSKIWLQLLQQHPGPLERSWTTSVLAAPGISEGQVVLGQATDRLVRELLERESMFQSLRALKDADTQAIEALQREIAERERKADLLLGKKESPKVPVDAGTIQSLQRQLAERDKKIDELSSQLEALKRIDQETREKIRPIRPPSAPTQEPATP